MTKRKEFEVPRETELLPMPEGGEADDSGKPARSAEQEALPLGARRARFAELYREHAGRIFAICLRITGDGDVAADVSQDAFMHAWRKFETFRGSASFGTWLYRIAIRRALDRIRADRRYVARVVTDSELTAYAAAVARAMPETRLDLERAIARLPEGARSVLILYEIEGYRYDEIASLLDISSGTVRSQLHRARRLLRDMLRPSDGMTELEG